MGQSPLYRPVNGRIACVPPTDTQVKTVVKNNFGRVSQKTQLTPLRVLWGNEYLREPKVFAPTGSVVFITGEATTNHQWAKQKYAVGDVEFILVPEEMIQIVDLNGNMPEVQP